MKPIIGVIPLFDEEKDSIWMVPGYMEGIRAAGGLPIILPLKAEEQETEQVCDMCDGFLFTGGHDVDPALYGAEKSRVDTLLMSLRVQFPSGQQAYDSATGSISYNGENVNITKEYL